MRDHQLEAQKHATPPLENCEMAKVNRKSFTLIEVMIILAIIALLVAMLLPSLSAARRQAQGIEEPALGSVMAESNEDNAYRYLPRTATNIIEHGNEWYEFTLNGNRWLYHTDRYDRESLVLIPNGATNGIHPLVQTP